MAAVERLLRVTGSWAGHEDDISVVCASSTLGEKLFQYAQDASLSHSVGKTIDAAVEEQWAKGVDITVEMMEHIRSAVANIL